MTSSTSKLLPHALALVIATLSMGCAMAPPENRPLTTSLALTSAREPPAQSVPFIVIAPLIPFTIAIDAAVIHPFQELDDATRHTGSVCWRTFGREGRYVTDCASIPFRATASAVVWVVNWTIRCIDNRPPFPRSEPAA